MESIVVGDLHGDISLYQQIKSKFKGEKIILVGDLLDSFVFTRAEQFNLLQDVLEDIEAGIVSCVKGNHEWSYLNPERMKCSGYASSFAATIIPLFSKMYRLMPNYIFDEEKKVLITHAGLSKRLLLWYLKNRCEVNTPEVEGINIKEFLESECRNLDSGYVYDIGASRGGSEYVGGIFWCDYFVDFTPIEGLTQIFGHTPVTEVKQKDTNWEIDCLQKKASVVRIREDNNVEIVEIM